MNFIANIYYRFYRMFLSLGEQDTPRYNAVLILSLFSMMNVLTATILLATYTDIVILFNWPKPVMFIVASGIIGLNAFIIFGKKRYLRFEEKYKNEKVSDKILGITLVWVYVAVSIFLFVISLSQLKIMRQI